jgi:phosphate transport system substrate-binding protein
MRENMKKASLMVIKRTTLIKALKRAGVFTMAIVLSGILLACSKNTSSDKNNGTNGSTDNTSKDLSGNITMAGSTSMEKLANAAGEAFMNKYPGVTVSAEFIGSGAGIEAVTAGTVDIGNSSRSLTEDEKSKGVVENIVAIDGIAVITDKANTVANITKEQLTRVYTGEITNWSILGGADQPIVVVGRESGSGTRGAFEELLGVADKCKYANEINSTGGVLAKVSSTPGAIGYVSLDIIDDTVNAVSIDSVEPTEENIVAGTYLLSRPFIMATVGELSEQSELVQEFFSYLKSDEGKQLIKDLGLIIAE